MSAAVAVGGAPFTVSALIALALVAFGLFLLLFKIGRPLRSLYVLRQPQRSWMSREAWVAAVLFPLGVLALWFDNRALLVAAALLVLGLVQCMQCPQIVSLIQN